jgi:DNA-binding ferritin-like protein (Dps family)
VVCLERNLDTSTRRGADKFLARTGRKRARKHVRDARDFNNIETRAVIKFLFLQGKAPKEIHAILTETLACFLRDRTKDSSAPLYYAIHFNNIETRAVIKFLFPQGKAPKEIHAILTETLDFFLRGRAKDLSAPLYYIIHFNNIEARAVIKFLFPQGEAPKEIHAILTEILACFLPGRAKDLSAPL